MRGSPTTSAASHVVSGTDATMPMLPTSALKISVATVSELATVPSDCRDCTNRMSKGSAAPAYASARVLTVEATWARPIRIAAVKIERLGSSGLADRSSQTAAAWVTVMSSSAPSAPITIPPSTTPLRSRPRSPIFTRSASSLANPEIWARDVNTLASRTVSASAASVPSSATVVRVLNPFARYSARYAIALAPNTATSTGLRPSRIAGRMNVRSTTMLAARPTSAARPRRRPSATTATAKMTASHSSTGRRCRSANWYWKPGSARGSYERTTSSPV
jgi:hypothetical protein